MLVQQRLQTGTQSPSTPLLRHPMGQASNTQLPVNLIYSFETLKKFDTQYSTIRHHHFTFMALVNLQQWESESLYSFMARFSDISVKIRNFNLKVALHSIIMALKPRSFSDNLCKLSPKDMNDLRIKASDYVQMKEIAKFCGSVCAGQSSAPYNHKNHRHLGRTNEKKGKSEGLT
ncbi:hypothetical protein CR513_21498, partial [Mucuna pruriens]